MTALLPATRVATLPHQMLGMLVLVKTLSGYMMSIDLVTSVEILESRMALMFEPFRMIQSSTRLVTFLSVSLPHSLPGSQWNIMSRVRVEIAPREPFLASASRISPIPAPNRSSILAEMKLRELALQVSFVDVSIRIHLLLGGDLVQIIRHLGVAMW